MPNMQFAVAMRALTVMVQGLDILIATKHTIQTKTRQAAINEALVLHVWNPVP